MEIKRHPFHTVITLDNTTKQIFIYHKDLLLIEKVKVDKLNRVYITVK